MDSDEEMPKIIEKVKIDEPV